MRTAHSSLLIATLLLVVTPETWGDSEVQFNRDIRPILHEHCVACHGGVKQAADLSFVYRDQALAVIEAGDPDGSYLIERVMSEDEEERMPPAEHGRRLSKG